MKRTALISLTAIYILSLVGIGINRFYCCGKLASVTLTYAAPDNVSKQTGKKDNCCKHEKQSFKVKDSHVTATSFLFSELTATIIPINTNWTSITFAVEQANLTNYRANAPPGDPDVPIYTLNCSYRI